MFVKNAFALDSNTDLAITISPSIRRIELDPGVTHKNNMTLHNPTDKTIKVKMSVAPYSVEDITYAPVYSVKNAYTQIVNWITFNEDEYEIEPNNSIVVDYTISVPDDAPGGGQYAVLFANVENPDSGENVQTYASAGMIIIAKVSGSTRTTGEISDVTLPKFLLSPPISGSATFENTGNVDADAKLSLKIENYFSGELIYDGTKDPQEKTILPGTKRTLDVSWSNIPRLGVLKVTMTTEFLGEAKVVPRVVIICPIWFIAIIALIIVAIIVRIVSGKKEQRRTRANSRNNQGSSEKLNI